MRILLLLLGCFLAVVYCSPNEDLEEYANDFSEDHDNAEDGYADDAAERDQMLETISRLVAEQLKNKDHRHQLRKTHHAKRQKGNAGLWGKRDIMELKLAEEQQRRNTRALITRLKAREIEELLKSTENKRRNADQHGSAGLWGKRTLSEARRSAGLKRKVNGKKQPDETGLWGKRVILPEFEEMRDVPEGNYHMRYLHRRKLRQPEDIGLWKGKRGGRDPTRGPNGGDEVGLWGRRAQHGDAGLWGRKRSLKNKNALSNRNSKIF